MSRSAFLSLSLYNGASPTTRFTFDASGGDCLLLLGRRIGSRYCRYCRCTRLLLLLLCRLLLICVGLEARPPSPSTTTHILPPPPPPVYFIHLIYRAIYEWAYSDWVQTLHQQQQQKVRKQLTITITLSHFLHFCCTSAPPAQQHSNRRCWCWWRCLLGSNFCFIFWDLYFWCVDWDAPSYRSFSPHFLPR